MKKVFWKAFFVFTLAIIMTVSMCVYSFASVTGYISSTDHDIVLNEMANYNEIECLRSLNVTTSTVVGQNELSWYTFVGDAQQLAYCNAIHGTSTITVDGFTSDLVPMIPKTSAINFLGINMYNYGSTCTALRQHNLDLVDVEGVSTVIVKNPDGDVITTYQKTLHMSA